MGEDTRGYVDYDIFRYNQKYPNISKNIFRNVQLDPKISKYFQVYSTIGIFLWVYV